MRQRERSEADQGQEDRGSPPVAVRPDRDADGTAEREYETAERPRPGGRGDGVAGDQSCGGYWSAWQSVGHVS
jgi:hypothetical protein